MFLNSSLNKFPIIETDREESSEWKRKKKRKDEASFLNARVRKGGMEEERQPRQFRRS